MPKQNWNPATNTYSIDLDPQDPNDAKHITVNNGRGKAIASMTPAELQAILAALNQIYKLGMI